MLVQHSNALELVVQSVASDYAVPCSSILWTGWKLLLLYIGYFVSHVGNYVIPCRKFCHATTYQVGNYVIWILVYC